MLTKTRESGRGLDRMGLPDIWWLSLHYSSIIYGRKKLNAKAKEYDMISRNIIREYFVRRPPLHKKIIPCLSTIWPQFSKCVYTPSPHPLKRNEIILSIYPLIRKENMSNILKFPSILVFISEPKILKCSYFFSSFNVGCT